MMIKQTFMWHLLILRVKLFLKPRKKKKKLTKEQQLKLEEEKLLEKHCREVDTKLINLKERLIEKQELNKKFF